MNILGKFLLSVFFISLTFLTLLVASFKFQLLEPTFWVDAYEEENVYPSLTQALKKVIEAQTRKEGGSASEAVLLANAITEENVKTTFERNITNLLNYANGEAKDLLIYLPLEAAPPGLLPGNLALGNEIPLESLVSLFGLGGISYSYIAIAGSTINISWFILLGILLLIIYSIYKATSPGKRFVHLGITFVATSFFVLLFSSLLSLMQANIGKDLVMQGEEPAQVLLGILAPPLISRMLSLWSLIAGGLGIVGILLLLLRKPGVGTPKKGKK